MNQDKAVCFLCFKASSEFETEEGLLEHYRRAHMDEAPSAYWELKEKMLTRSRQVREAEERKIGAVA